MYVAINKMKQKDDKNKNKITKIFGLKIMPLCNTITIYILCSDLKKGHKNTIVILVE